MFVFFGRLAERCRRNLSFLWGVGLFTAASAACAAANSVEMLVVFRLAPGLLLVPTVSLLFSRAIIARVGAAATITAGIVSFALGLVCWATMLGAEPNMAAAIFGMALTGIGVGLTLPTLMGVGMASLPASAFATGSGVIKMIRQAGLAIGVGALVAVVGSPKSLSERMDALRLGCWVMVVVILMCAVPTLWLLRPRRQSAMSGAAKA